MDKSSGRKWLVAEAEAALNDMIAFYAFTVFGVDREELVNQTDIMVDAIDGIDAALQEYLKGKERYEN